MVQSLKISAMAFFVTLLVSSATATCNAETGSQTAEWTVLVYMDGDNSLDEYSEMDVMEMMSADFTEDVRVLVLWDRLDLPVYLYEVSPGGLDMISGLTVNGIDLNGEEVYMADPAILNAFVDFGTAMYPSENLMVILWDHGDPLFGVCWDEHFEYPWFPYQGSLSYDDIGRTLVGHDVDVLAFDTCSAGMSEIAYLYGQMNACNGLDVDYIVASEIYVPCYGYPYDAILTRMNLMVGSSEALDIASMIVEEYADSYSAESPENGGNTACLSVIDPNAMFNAVETVRGLTNLLQARLETDYETYKAIISLARGDANLIWGVPSSYGFVDFPKFVQGLTKTPGDKELRVSAQTALSALQRDVVLCVGNADAAESGGAMGLGIWFPPTCDEFSAFVLQYYFDFGEDSGWLDFLHAFWPA